MLLTSIIVNTQLISKAIVNININSKSYRGHFELLEKYHVSLKKHLLKGISNPEFYGDFVYVFRKINGNRNYFDLFIRILNRFGRTGYTLDIMRHTPCLDFNPIVVEGYTPLFSCTALCQTLYSMTSSM